MGRGVPLVAHSKTRQRPPKSGTLAPRAGFGSSWGAALNNRNRSWPALTLALMLALAACGEEDADADDAPVDSGPSVLFADANGAGTHDSSAATDAGQLDGATSNATDVATSADVGSDEVAGVALVIDADETLQLAESVALDVVLQLGSGAKRPPTEAEVPELLIDGKPVGSKGWVAAEGQAQPTVALWPGSNPGKWTVVAIRPGKAVVQMRFGGALSNALPFDCQWPDEVKIRVTIPGASGSTDAERKIDVAHTIKLGGATIGAGGLEATIRFPATAKAGDRFDMSVKPASGGLSVSASLADVPGVKQVLAQGALWVDQVGNGRFRGTFHGIAANLKPLAGAFVVDRKGLFGVDLLGAATEVKKSDSLLPQAGAHYSRATVHAVPGGKAMLIYRHIANKTKASLVRVLIDPISGALDTSLPPLVDDANAYAGTPDVFAHAFGWVASAGSAGKTLFVWEGRDGKGSKKPHQLWGRIYDEKHQPLTPPAVIAEDNCDGNCRPEVHALPASRWLVLWSGDQGGIRARRVSGNLADGQLGLPGGAPETLIVAGNGATATTWEGNALVGWRDASLGPVWRMYGYTAGDDKLKSAMSASAFGATSKLSPQPALVALQTPSGGANLLFVGAWADAKAPGSLNIRRIASDGTALGVDLPLGDSQVDRLLAAAGKLGQVTLVERVEASAQGKSTVALRARKTRYLSIGDVGDSLGEVLEIAPATGAWAAEPGLVYVPEADAYVVAWSGEHSSGGVWIRRFR